MDEEVLLLAAVNLLLLLVLLVGLRKYLSLKVPEPVQREPRSRKVERIEKILSEGEQEEEDELKALVLGMITAGKSDQEIVSELRKRGLREKEIRGLLEELA